MAGKLPTKRPLKPLRRSVTQSDARGGNAGGARQPRPTSTAPRNPFGIHMIRTMTIDEYNTYFRLNKSLDDIYRAELRAARLEQVAEVRAALDMPRGTERTRKLREIAGYEGPSDASDAPEELDLEEFAQEVVGDAEAFAARLRAAGAADTADESEDAVEDVEDVEDVPGSGAERAQGARVIEFTALQGALAFFKTQNDGVMPEGISEAIEPLFKQAEHVPGSTVSMVQFLPPGVAPGCFRLRVPNAVYADTVKSVRENARERLAAPESALARPDKAKAVDAIDFGSICRLLGYIVLAISVCFALLAGGIMHFFPETVHFGTPRAVEKADYYGTLNVPETATAPQLKKAYYKLVRQYHPDHHPNCAECPAKFAALVEAYEVLTDPKRRAWFDEFGTDLPSEVRTHEERKDKHFVKPVRQFSH